MTSIGGLFHAKEANGLQFEDEVEQQNKIMTRYREHADMMNYFADTVSIPGRRITVGTVRDVGAMRRFATDTTFSEVQVSFLLPKDMYHRVF